MSRGSGAKWPDSVGGELVFAMVSWHSRQGESV
jgi:hypothetical protein